jgi:hypothetical protein
MIRATMLWTTKVGVLCLSLLLICVRLSCSQQPGASITINEHGLLYASVQVERTIATTTSSQEGNSFWTVTVEEASSNTRRINHDSKEDHLIVLEQTVLLEWHYEETGGNNKRVGEATCTFLIALEPVQQHPQEEASYHDYSSRTFIVTLWEEDHVGPKVLLTRRLATLPRTTTSHHHPRQKRFNNPVAKVVLFSTTPPVEHVQSQTLTEPTQEDIEIHSSVQTWRLWWLLAGISLWYLLRDLKKERNPNPQQVLPAVPAAVALLGEQRILDREWEEASEHDSCSDDVRSEEESTMGNHSSEEEESLLSPLEESLTSEENEEHYRDVNGIPRRREEPRRSVRWSDQEESRAAHGTMEEALLVRYPAETAHHSSSMEEDETSSCGSVVLGANEDVLVCTAKVQETGRPAPSIHERLCVSECQPTKLTRAIDVLLERSEASFDAMHRPAEIETTSGFQSLQLLQDHSNPSTPEESSVPITEETAPQDYMTSQSNTISNCGRPATSRQPNVKQDNDMQAAATSSDERPRTRDENPTAQLHGEESIRPSAVDDGIRLNHGESLTTLRSLDVAKEALPASRCNTDTDLESLKEANGTKALPQEDEKGAITTKTYPRTSRSESLQNSGAERDICKIFFSSPRDYYHQATSPLVVEWTTQSQTETTESSPGDLSAATINAEIVIGGPPRSAMEQEQGITHRLTVDASSVIRPSSTEGTYAVPNDIDKASFQVQQGTVECQFSQQVDSLLEDANTQNHEDTRTVDCETVETLEMSTNEHPQARIMDLPPRRKQSTTSLPAPTKFEMEKETPKKVSEGSWNMVPRVVVLTIILTQKKPATLSVTTTPFGRPSRLPRYLRHQIIGAKTNPTKGSRLLGVVYKPAVVPPRLLSIAR